MKSGNNRTGLVTMNVFLNWNKSLLISLRNKLNWNRSSYIIISSFLLVVFLITVIWWPLAEEYLSQYDPHYPFWMQFDWLLFGIFLTMSFLIMSGANINTDIFIVVIGLMGGLIIESWGTQTELWSYYTLERPPLWIIPAWSIASLSIDRVVHISNKRLPSIPTLFFQYFYWICFSIFFILLITFVSHTFDKPLTWLATITCILLITTPTDHRLAVITFLSGSGLGYFLELWGTTRGCWTYYSAETPPLFAVLAHGLAAVSFWRVLLIIQHTFPYISKRYSHFRSDNGLL